MTISPAPESARGGPVVVGVDGGPSCAAVLEWAAQESRRTKLGLQVVHVHDPTQQPFGAGEPWTNRSRRAAARRKVEDVVSSGAAAGLDVSVRYGVGSAAGVLASVAADAGASPLVVGARSCGAAGSPLGPVAQLIAHQYHAPMVVVPSGASAVPEDRIVVGVDGTDLATGALCWAVKEAAARGSVVDAVIAWASPTHAVLARGEIESILREILNDAIHTAGASIAPVRLHVSQGAAHEELVARARGAQLLVVGAHQRTPDDEQVLGSVSGACAVYAPVPVALIPAPVQATQVLAS